MRFRVGLLTALTLAGLACRSPLTHLHPGKEGPAFFLTVGIEDHSRKLAHLWDPAGEDDTSVSRRAALEQHRKAFEADLRTEAASRHLRLDPMADLHLDLTITSLGEVRAKYIVWGILSGVAWGVGTGLLVHNTSLAVGLGMYELLEESAFWIGGSMLMGRWSSPAVVKARLRQGVSDQPLWEETYYVLWARQELKAFPLAERVKRQNQLQASLHKVMGKLFQDLETIPTFPPGVRRPQAPRELPPSPAAAPGPPRPG